MEKRIPLAGNPFFLQKTIICVSKTVRNEWLRSLL